MNNTEDRSNDSHKGRIIFQIILGTVGVYLGVMLWVSLSLPVLAIGFGVYGVTFVTASLVVYIIGRLSGYRSSYFFTLLFAAVGLVVGAGLYTGLIYFLRFVGYVPG